MRTERIKQREVATVKKCPPRQAPHQLLSSGEAAILLGCDGRRVRSLCQAKRIDAIMVGRQWLMTLENLNNFIDHGKLEKGRRWSGVTPEI